MNRELGGTAMVVGGGATDEWARTEVFVPDFGSAAAGLLVREPRPRTKRTKLRIYVDTSVIGGCENERFAKDSWRLIERARWGEVTLVVSDVTVEELEGAPPEVQGVLESVGAKHIERIRATAAADALADRYIEPGALTEKSRTDARHIAVAAVAGVDYLASWNMRHIVNRRRIPKYNMLNREMGFAPLKIRRPKEIET